MSTSPKPTAADIVEGSILVRSAMMPDLLIRFKDHWGNVQVSRRKNQGEGFVQARVFRRLSDLLEETVSVIPPAVLKVNP